MKLAEILYVNNIHWPNSAEKCYQSAIDCEIYFLNEFNQRISSTKRTPLPIAEDRGQNHKLTYRKWMKFLSDLKFKKTVITNGGVTGTKQQERDRMIKRIENGLRRDFDIDSHEFAVYMWENGWRR